MCTLCTQDPPVGKKSRERRKQDAVTEAFARTEEEEGVDDVDGAHLQLDKGSSSIKSNPSIGAVVLLHHLQRPAEKTVSS